MAITQERATMIARSHHCSRCQEYSWKRVAVKPAAESLRKEFNEQWHAALVCGVCDLHQEIGIDEEGDVIYVS